MEYCNPGILQSQKIGLLEALRIGFPGRQFPVVQSQQAQHVDHGSAADQVDGASGILGFTLGEQGEAAAVDHWPAYSQRRALQDRTTREHEFAETG